MTRKNLILIGGGGHCKSCIDTIESHGIFKVAGVVDIPEKIGENVLKYKVIASDHDLTQLVKKYKYFFITIGSVRDPSPRIAKFEYLKELGAHFPAIISPRAFVSKSAKVGEGTIVMPQAVIHPDANVGRNCIINTAAIIEHDVFIGEHCHVSTGSIVNGKSHIGNRVFLGSNSTIIHEISVIDDVIIGAGCVVTKSIDRAGIYVGNPARKIKG